jgi:ribonuclease P protein component
MDRLKKRSDFQRLSASGQKVVTTTFIMLAAVQQAQGEARMGFTVTKRNGNAVKRNRIRRRLREAAKELWEGGAMHGKDYVLIAREKALDCPYGEILRDLRYAFRKIAGSRPSAEVERPL